MYSFIKLFVKNILEEFFPKFFVKKSIMKEESWGIFKIYYRETEDSFFINKSPEKIIFSSADYSINNKGTQIKYRFFRECYFRVEYEEKTLLEIESNNINDTMEGFVITNFNFNLKNRMEKTFSSIQ